MQYILAPAVTVMEAIHDLPELRAGDKKTQYRSDISPSSYEVERRKNTEQLTLHEATAHTEKMLKVIKCAGANIFSLPPGMVTSGFSTSYSRIEPDQPSVTLTVNFVHPGSNKCIHPYQDRALTPREGARLQGFDDDYIFVGNRSQIVKQIGNAVPPLLGRAIASALLPQW
jgi:DNA (cytosine-5)-methyltransferase 1